MSSKTDALASRAQGPAPSRVLGESKVDWLTFYERDVKPRMTMERVFVELRHAQLSDGKLRASCPLHGGQDLAFAVDLETYRWFCHSTCKERGGPIDYVHRALGLSGKPRGREFIAAIKELARRCGVDMPALTVTCATPLADVEHVWNDAQPVTTDARVCRWLTRHRKLDPDLIAALDLARVLSSGAALPVWAGYEYDGHWHPWTSAGHRIVVPLYNARGRMVSLRFRAPAAGMKGRCAYGASTVGMVMADPLARSVLAAGNAPEFRSLKSFAVVVAEGEADYLSWATELARRGFGENASSPPAILGVVQGSFDMSIAQRLPIGTRITSAVDRDLGGDRIHARLTQVLSQADRNFTLTRGSAS